MKILEATTIMGVMVGCEENEDMSKLIYLVTMNDTPIRAAMTKEVAENYIQCLKEEIEEDTRVYLYDHDEFRIQPIYLED